MMAVTKRYEIAASHTLKRDDWDRQRNIEAFGKCANPTGHGHNYMVEITVSGELDEQTGMIGDYGLIDRTVMEWIIDRFDHKNLNTDTAEFAELNPTVENMAKVFWELLYGRFGDAQLRRVRVWETTKTYADYYGEDAGNLRDIESV